MSVVSVNHQPHQTQTLTNYLPEPGNWKYEKVSFDRLNTSLWCLVVTLNSQEYKRADDCSKIMWSESKKGQYGKGLINEESDPHKISRIGKLGEIALSKIYRCPVDLSYRKFGDAYDFSIEEKTVDLKTAASKHGSLLVREVSANGQIVPLTNDLYVAACLLEENRQTQAAKVALAGWATKQEMQAAPLVKAYIGTHQNRQLLYTELQPIDSLERYLDA